MKAKYLWVGCVVVIGVVQHGWAQLPTYWTCSAVIATIDPYQETGTLNDSDDFSIQSLDKAIRDTFNGISWGSLQSQCQFQKVVNSHGFVPSSFSWQVEDESSDEIYLCAYACEKYEVYPTERMLQAWIKSLSKKVRSLLPYPEF